MRERLMDKCRHCTQCVEEIDFLAGLPVEQQNKIMECAVRESHRKGSFLFLERDSVEAIYILHSGRVKLSTVDSEGREQIIGICSGRDTIWEGMLMEGGRYPYAAACLTDVDCCRIFRRDFTKILADPIIALRVIALMSQKLREANARNLLLTTSDSKARLAGFLAGRARQTARDVVALRLDEIAASINLRPETVSRKLRELERAGLVAREGQSGIRILDAAALRELFEEH
jgi:CRP/FNR family transcriptional regulator